jgi:hypothetical protein
VKTVTCTWLAGDSTVFTCETFSDTTDSIYLHEVSRVTHGGYLTAAKEVRIKKIRIPVVNVLAVYYE